MTDPSRSEIWHMWLESKAALYANTPIIVKDTQSTKVLDMKMDQFPSLLKSNVYIASTFQLPCYDERSMVAALRYLRALGFFSRTDAPQWLVIRRASLVCITLLAIRLGYQRVVLCGIDLNNTSYFFEENRGRYESAGLPVPLSGQSGNLHKTVDPAWGGLTVDLVLLAIHEHVCRPKGVEILVGQRSSALHPRFPCYDW